MSDFFLRISAPKFRWDIYVLTFCLDSSSTLVDLYIAGFLRVSKSLSLLYILSSVLKYVLIVHQ